MKKIPGDIILLYINVYHKWRSYDIWFLKFKVRQKFLSFWVIFCPFSPLTAWKIKILKLKETPVHIIISQIFTINDMYLWFLRYRAWQTEFFCHSGPFFPLSPPLPPHPMVTENQNLKKMKKKHLKILSFSKWVP